MWASFPVLLHTSAAYGDKYVEQALAEAKRGRRRRFHVATRADLEALAKEAAKAKGKSKDPSQQPIMDACASALENGVLTSRGAAMIVSAQMMVSKTTELQRREQEQAAKQAALAGASTEVCIALHANPLCVCVCVCVCVHACVCLCVSVCAHNHLHTPMPVSMQIPFVYAHPLTYIFTQLRAGR